MDQRTNVSGLCVVVRCEEIGWVYRILAYLIRNKGQCVAYAVHVPNQDHGAGNAQPLYEDVTFL